jgi:hypothetical protein
VVEIALNVEKTLATGWADDLDQLTALVESWVPAGWQAHKDKLLAPESDKIVDALVMNPNYQMLCSGAEMLESIRKNVKSVNGDGAEPIAAPGVMKHSLDVVSLASEKITITYAIFHLTKEIPAITRPNERKAASKKLQSEIGKKVGLGQSLTDRLNLLLAGKLPAGMSEAAAAEQPKAV